MESPNSAQADTLSDPPTLARRLFAGKDDSFWCMEAAWFDIMNRNFRDKTGDFIVHRLIVGYVIQIVLPILVWQRIVILSHCRTITGRSSRNYVLDLLGPKIFSRMISDVKHIYSKCTSCIPHNLKCHKMCGIKLFIETGLLSTSRWANLWSLQRRCGTIHTSWS